MAQVHLICYVLRLGMGTLVARWVACGGTFLFSLAACNLVTGAGDLSVADDGSSSGAGGNGSGGQGTGAGVSNNDLLPTDAASITAIEMYQSVRRPLMEGGAAASSTVPLVAERDAMMRIHYTASARVEVTVLINIGDADPIVVPASLNGTSDVATLTSTINVPIPGEILQTGVGYRVELLEARDNTSGTNAGAVYPASGQEMMPLVSAGGPLKLVLVPITYGADGSDRLPDTSMAHIEEYRELFLSYYPVPDVAITVSGPIQWNSTVSAGGPGVGHLARRAPRSSAESGGTVGRALLRHLQPSLVVQQLLPRWMCHWSFVPRELARRRDGAGGYRCRLHWGVSGHRRA